MKKVVRYLSKPQVNSIFPAILIILLIPINLSRYSLSLISSFRLNNHEYIWYDDLDNSGSSEKIQVYDAENNASIVVYNDSGLLNQWNFKGNFSFGNTSTIFITGDYNHSGKKDIYVFSIHHDSIFLSAVSDLHDHIPRFKNRFVCTTGWGINRPDPFIIPAEMADLDGDGQKELIFGIGSGYSKYPRNVFAYYIEKDSMVRSPESYFGILRISMADLTGNGRPEMILSGYNPKNLNQDTVRFHDTSNWLMVLNHKLEFLFEPVEFGSEYSGINSFPLKREGRQDLYSMQVRSGQTTLIHKHDLQGNILSGWEYDFPAYDILQTIGRSGKQKLALKAADKGFVFLDQDFNTIRNVKCNWPHQTYQEDITGDSAREIIIPYYPQNKLLVYDAGFRHPASTDVFLETGNSYLLTIKRNIDSQDLISLQCGQNHYLFEYGKNPYYLLNYALFPLIYLGCFGFIWLIMFVQKTQLEKKHKTEKRLNGLQLSLAQNQLNSHFSLNVMNSVLCSIMVNEAEEACENLRRFAGLYKSVLHSAGSVVRKLSEETEFCENYLLLEKSRLNGRLEFEIIVSERVDPDFPVPVMAIHLYAENAIKHGIAPLEGKGILKIIIDQKGTTLEVTVTDNGIGRKNAAGNSGNSTGKGIEIMNDFFSHLESFYNYDIKSGITDLYDENGQPAGTSVELSITKGNENK